MGALRTELARWQAKQETNVMSNGPQHIEVASYPGQGRIEKAQRNDGGFTYHFTTTTRLNDNGDVGRASVRNLDDLSARTAWPTFMREAKAHARFLGLLYSPEIKNKIQDAIIMAVGTGQRGRVMLRERKVKAEVVAPAATASPDTVTLNAIRIVNSSGADPATKGGSIALLLAGERQTKSAEEILADNAWTAALDAATRK